MIVIETSIIVGAVVYVITNATLAGIIIMLKKAGANKYAKVIKSLESISRKNNEVYELLTENGSNQPSITNEPYEPSDASDDGDKTVRSTRGVKLIQKLMKNGHLKTKDYELSVAETKK